MRDLSIQTDDGGLWGTDACAQVINRVLDTLQLVDTPPEEAFDKFTRLTARFIKVPVALVSFVEEDRDRQYFKSEIGLTGTWAETRQTPLSHSFCQHVKSDNRPLIVEYAPDDARVCDNLAIPNLGVRAYLGTPIHGPDGAALGALCAIDSKRRRWSQTDIDVMTDLAACVTDQAARGTVPIAWDRRHLTPGSSTTAA